MPVKRLCDFLNSHTRLALDPNHVEVSSGEEAFKQICCTASPTRVPAENQVLSGEMISEIIFLSYAGQLCLYITVLPLIWVLTLSVCVDERQCVCVAVHRLCAFQLTFVRLSFGSSICFISSAANSSLPASHSSRYQLSESLQPAGGSTKASSTPPSLQPSTSISHWSGWKDI